VWKTHFTEIADTIIYTGPIDAYYEYCYGRLGYRSIGSDVEILPIKSFQDNAVVNYTSKEVRYTRIIEHKFFEDVDCPYTVISGEFTNSNGYPCYPIRNDANISRYNKYKELAKDDKVIFGGRLGEYKYYDMDQTIESALKKCGELLANQ
jgi:UDP-galactopyranose mutase